METKRPRGVALSGLALVLFALTAASAFSATIATPSYLQVNLGPMPFDAYDTAHTGTTYFPTACASGLSVRACMQGLLSGFAAQKVDGVRFQFAICGGAHSTPLVESDGHTNACGNHGYQTAQISTTWLANLSNFFADLSTAGIRNVTFTIAHTGYSGDFGESKTWTTSPVGSAACGSDPNPLYFWAAAPYGTLLSNGFPRDQGNNSAYNCSPTNPIFIGWGNIYPLTLAVIDAVATAGLTLYEIDESNEIDLLNFTVTARLIYDNAEGGLSNVLTQLRLQMYNSHFDPYRVTWSTGNWPSTLANYNGCVDVYDDYARLINLDELASAIDNGYVGFPQGDYATINGLPCYGTTTAPTNSMITLPIYSALPDIVDFHDYPCVHVPLGGCVTTDSGANVQKEAQIDFSDLLAYFADLHISPTVVVVGETHSYSTSTSCGGGLSLTCECAPPMAASETVAGYNASTFAGNTIVFRPWLKLSNACYSSASPDNIGVNLNNNGPYTPALQ